MNIDIFQDTVCPWCRIGKSYLAEALGLWKGEQVSVRFRAFRLDPSIPPQGVPFAEAMNRKLQDPGGEKLQAVLDVITRAGRQADVAFRFDRITTMPDTRLSHRLIAAVPESSKSLVLDRIYRVYFEEGLDIGKESVLLRIAGECGLNPAELSKRLYHEDVENSIRADYALAKRLNINGVPFFILNKKVGFSGARPPEALLDLMKRVSEDRS